MNWKLQLLVIISYDLNRTFDTCSAHIWTVNAQKPSDVEEAARYNTANYGAHSVPCPKNNTTAPRESEGSQIITSKLNSEKVRASSPLLKKYC